MVQPTDRVIAKTFAKIIKVLFKEAGIDPVEGGAVLAVITVVAAKGNVALMAAISRILRETAEEEVAEAAGLASSNVGVQAPWEEYDGSDYSFENH